MDYQELENLASRYANALEEEYRLGAEVVDVQSRIERLEVGVVEQAVIEGKIDGKNADTRKAQRAAIISNDLELASARETLKQALRSARMAEIESQRLKGLIGLTKAWLYSQADTPRLMYTNV